MKKTVVIPGLTRDLYKYLYRFQLKAGMTWKFCLIVIIVLAAFLRFYKLGQIPPSLDWDEVSLGYNAWALLETGKDEFGNSWPLSIRSFGDYKPPVYTYLLIPSLKIFGRTEFAIRFPSALAGTLTVLATYFLAKELLKPDPRRHFFDTLGLESSLTASSPPGQSGSRASLGSSSIVSKMASSDQTIPLLSAFLLAISPWHLQFSRIGFEANVGLLFFVTGMWLLIRALRRSLPWSMFLAVVSISAGMMTYHSLRLVAPLVVLATLWIYRSFALGYLVGGNLLVRRHPLPRLRRGRGKPLATLGVASDGSSLTRKFANLDSFSSAKLTSLPLILSAILTILTVSTIFYTVFFQNVGQSRFRETSFLTIDDLMTVSRQRIEKSGGNLLDRAVNHRFLVYGRQYLRGYLDHYNLRFWFLDGDRNDRHRTPGVGLLYWWEFPLLVMGLMGLMRPMGQMAAKEKTVLFLWLFLAPAAAALTGGTPSAVRSLAFLPIFQIMEGVGAMVLISEIRNHKSYRRVGKLFLISYFLFLIFETSYYFHQYYVQAAVETAPAWQYGYKQLVNKVMSEKDNYQKVIVTTAYDQPYIYFLWYGNYDPKFWINDGEFNKRFDKFEFRKIEWGDLSGQEKTLVISSPDETKGKPVKWQIDFPDGKTAFNATEL